MPSPSSCSSKPSRSSTMPSSAVRLLSVCLYLHIQHQHPTAVAAFEMLPQTPSMPSRATHQSPLAPVQAFTRHHSNRHLPIIYTVSNTMLETPAFQESVVVQQDIASDMASLPDCYYPQGTTTIPTDDTIQHDQAPPHVSTKRKRKGPTIDTWKRRLNTKEDKFNMHKISGLAYVFSSTLIMGTGLFHGFHEIPDWLMPVDLMHTMAVAVQSATSIGMAMSHRKGQPKAMDSFVNMAFITLFVAMTQSMYTPFFPEVLADETSFHSAIALLGFPTLASCQKGFAAGLPARLAEEERELQKKLRAMRRKEGASATTHTGTENTLDSWNEFLFNDSTKVLMAMTLAALLWPGHDRAWLLNFADSHSGASTFYYAQTFQIAGSMYSALLLTLKDKKLISRETEKPIQFLFSSAIFASTIALVTL